VHCVIVGGVLSCAEAAKSRAFSGDAFVRAGTLFDHSPLHRCRYDESPVVSYVRWNVLGDVRDGVRHRMMFCSVHW